MRDSRALRFRRVAACFFAVGVTFICTAGRAEAFLPSWTWRTYTATAPSHGWAWELQRSQLPSLGALSGVPAGEFAVAWLGQPDKIAYLGIGGAGYRDLGPTTLVLPVDADASNANAETADIRACVIMTEWVPAEPIAWDERPATLCDGAAKGVYDGEASAFRFPLTSLREALSSPGVKGISIEPAESPADPFQVVFKEVQLVEAARLEARAALHTAPPPRSREQATSEVEPDPSAAARPSADGATLSAGTAGPTPVPASGSGRPISLSGVYAALAALAILILVGRALAQGTRKSKEGER